MTKLDNELLTPSEVAGLLKVTSRHVLNLVRDEKLDAVAISPRVIRIKRASVEKLIKG